MNTKLPKRKRNERSPIIKWSILRKIKSGKVKGNFCRLRQEKLAIATYMSGTELLDGRSEIMNFESDRKSLQCKHPSSLVPKNVNVVSSAG